MVAVTEAGVCEPAGEPGAGWRVAPARRRRLVAVAVTSMELFRPESDLVRLCEAADAVDLLVACDDGPAFDEDEDEDEDDTQARADRMEVGELHLHRLGLRAPLGAQFEGDLVAALSELVGFDPEPGVYCLAPALAASDPNRTGLDQAVARIAQVYGIPLLRYRCLELSVVGDDR